MQPAESRSDRVAQRPVGRDATDHGDRAGTGALRRGRQAGHQLIDRGHLEARREIGDDLRVAGDTSCGECSGTEVTHHVANGGLQATERERALEAGTGHREPGGITRRRDPLDRRTARVLQAEEAGDLVEGFACGVVPGGRQPFGDAVLAEHDALGVSTADQQGQVRRLQVGVGEPCAVHVPGEVRDADDRKPAGQRGAGGVHGADDQASGEPGTSGHGDGVDGVPAAGDRRKRGLDDGGEPLEVGARGQLGDDTAVDRVQGNLRRHHRRTHVTAVGKHRRCGLVAGGFDGQEVQADGYSIEGPPPTPATSRPLRIATKPRLNPGAWMLSLHMITASSPLSV